MRDESLVRFRRVVAAACAELESRRGEVNDLNVFPVADGDTGDNMAMTMRAVLDELDSLNGRMIDEIGREELVSAVARAALLGARGNSGVILSQIVRGAAEELASRPGELVDPVLVAAAFARAADAAYDSVRDPAEGTMLSAVRAMAHRVAHDLAHMDNVRLVQGASVEEQDDLIAQVLERALDAAKDAVERGPDQLPVLKEAGVVDAGAYGLTVIVAGVVAALRGDEGPQLEHQAPAHSLHLPQHEDSRFRYCTNFAVSGSDLEGQALRAAARGARRLGARGRRRAHDPRARAHRRAGVRRRDLRAARRGVAARRGRHARADRRSQRAARGRGGGTTCGVVAVASGDGMRRLYEELGAHVVDGGATMNPSTYELLAGIHAAASAEVVVLPNSPNVILAAERAAELSEKPAAVVPTTAPAGGPRGAALLRSRAAGRAEPVRRRGRPRRGCGWAAWRARRRTTPRAASRPATPSATSATSWSGWGEPESTLRATLAAVAEGAELVTCIAGQSPAARARGDRGRAARGSRARVPRGRPAGVVVAVLRRVDPLPSAPRRITG